MLRRPKHFIRNMEHLQRKWINIFTLIGSFQSALEVWLPNQPWEVGDEPYVDTGERETIGVRHGQGHLVVSTERVFSKTQPRPRVPSTWPPVCEHLLWEPGRLVLPQGPQVQWNTFVRTTLMQGLSRCPARRKS